MNGYMEFLKEYLLSFQTLHYWPRHEFFGLMIIIAKLLITFEHNSLNDTQHFPNFLPIKDLKSALFLALSQNHIMGMGWVGIDKGWNIVWGKPGKHVSLVMIDDLGWAKVNEHSWLTPTHNQVFIAVTIIVKCFIIAWTKQLFEISVIINNQQSQPRLI